MKVDLSVKRIDGIKIQGSRNGTEIAILAQMDEAGIREMMAEGMKHLTDEQMHEWMEEFLPHYAKALEKVEGE
jgi:hypothetical protein